MNSGLGKWAVIDIETTGIDPLQDSIIDIGFLQFEGTTLVQKYSSLVRYTPEHGGEISQFIQKLTGISTTDLKKAPTWNYSLEKLLELEGHHLIAHNSSFEEKFLKKYFEKNNFKNKSEETHFIDSILFLALLSPEKSTLNLESFILELGIKEKEDHRGFEDSLDLLKVMLLLTYRSFENLEKRNLILSLFEKYQLGNYWFAKFYLLSKEDLNKIAQQIDFSLETKKLSEIKEDQTEGHGKTNFSTDFNASNIESIFKNESEIKKISPNYRFRESQLQFSIKVGQAFKNNIHALIQAPTGTGKTFGYLVPAMLFAKSEKKQVLVATGTKALQAQAMEKDVPNTLKILNLKDELKISELVGSNNHLCELKFRGEEGELSLLDGNSDFNQAYSKMYFDLLFYFNLNTDQNHRLNRMHIPFALKRMVKEIETKELELVVDYRACTGNNCPLKDSCSYLQGLREAKDSDIIIGNHALMFNWPKSFPRPSQIIVDEAHKLEHEATSVFSKQVSSLSLENFYRSLVGMQGIGALFYLLGKEDFHRDNIQKIRSEVNSMLEILAQHLTSLEPLVESFFKKLPKYSPLYWNEVPMISKSQVKDQLAISIYNHFESIKYVFKNLSALLAPYMAMFDPKNLKEQNEQIAFARFESFMGNLLEILDNLEVILSEDSLETIVMKFKDDEGYELISSPINVGKKIADGLLETSASVVFTSATLANAKGDSGIQGVEWLTGYTYVPHDRRFKSGFFLPPVYDYQNQAKVFLINEFLSFNHANFPKAVIDSFKDLILEIGGRTLLLFSSRIRFQNAVEILLKEFEGKIPVFVQGLGHNVVEEFKKSGGGILIGMESFGEGIDIPGNMLELVIIDKIPDLRNDKVYKDRQDYFEKSFGNAFHDYFMANRARSLHQKLGRLIRTEKDIGCVFIIDSRTKTWKPATLNYFIKMMQPYQLTISDLDSAKAEALQFIQCQQRS